ncbi:MAG: hypothetical protein WCO72_07940 [Betaproteobacteria bacterium]
MNKISGLLSVFDQFGQKAEFRVSRKNQTKKSVVGSLVTLVVLITTIAYTSTKMLEMTGRKQTNYSQYLEPNGIPIG